jgi:hypothetical protein
MTEALLVGIRSGVFREILLSDALSARFEWIEEEIQPYYTGVDEPIFEDPRAFWPVTGVRLRPERIYVRNAPAAPPVPTR